MIRRILILGVAVATALAAAGCGNPPPANTNVNANAVNSNSGAKAAAPTKEELLSMDQKANEAFLKGDFAYFEGMLSQKFVDFMDGKRGSRDEQIAMVKGVKCTTKSWNVDEPQMTKISDDVYAISYKGTFDGTCSMGSDEMKIPSPVRAASIWVRENGVWKGVYHNEIAIMDSNAAASEKTTDKKEAPKPPEPEKKAAEPASNTSAANTAAAPAADSNTEALVKLHQAGWEAFKAKDAKWFEQNLAETFGGVAPNGSWMGSKADTIKGWTDPEGCKDVTTVKVSDGLASSIAPNVELLTLKGTADGTCGGQKNGSLYQTAVYVKDGENWKLAFMFEAPAM